LKKKKRNFNIIEVFKHVEHHEYSGIWAFVQRIGASKYLTWFGNAIGLINFIILVVNRKTRKRNIIFM
jgi:hypothetical protein